MLSKNIKWDWQYLLNSLDGSGFTSSSTYLISLEITTYSGLLFAERFNRVFVHNANKEGSRWTKLAMNIITSWKRVFWIFNREYVCVLSHTNNLYHNNMTSFNANCNGLSCLQPIWWGRNRERDRKIIYPNTKWSYQLLSQLLEYTCTY